MVVLAIGLTGVFAIKIVVKVFRFVSDTATNLHLEMVGQIVLGSELREEHAQGNSVMVSQSK